MTAELPVAVITIVSGRHDHLRRQLAAFAHSTEQPDVHIVVAMNDPEIAAVTADHNVRVLECTGDDPATLELARARNLGAAAAIEAGARLLVFLDVDCIPGTTLLARYLSAHTATPEMRLLYCGPVTYLPARHEVFDPRELPAFTAPHAARPAPPHGQTRISTEMSLFWSLSFAITAPDWTSIGGFHTGYRGYGGEDTDFAMTAARAGMRIAWVGGADAYHQYHPVSTPPVEHLTDILRNGRLFRSRWGSWPMQGWLEAFAERGLIGYDEAADDWRLTA